MRVAVSADESPDLVPKLVASLQRRGHEVRLFGTTTVATADATEVHGAAAGSVVDGWADTAVVCSWSGAGAAIFANTVPGVRAAHCTDAETARVARRWAQANVLALSLRLTSDAQMEEILDAWLATDPTADRLDDASVSARLATSGSGTLDRIVTDLESGPWLREQVLNPLSRHDAVRGTCLQDTLVVFCRSRFSLRLAAESLQVHANTVGYRMRKIREVTGLDYLDIDDLVLLTLAARTLGGPTWQTRLPWVAEGSRGPVPV